jgi:hypothetical protein
MIFYINEWLKIGKENENSGNNNSMFYVQQLLLGTEY